MLIIKNVNKQYGDIQALKNVSLEIPEGSCFGLVGPNGAGKSTLIKVITTIIHDFNGTITLNDKPFSNKIKNKIGYIPQEICLEQTVSALQNLYFFGKIYGLKGNQLSIRANEILNYIGLTDRRNDKVKTFSGGMKRRLNIGCALMHEPKLIIMDEPTVGVDPQSRQYIFNMIDQLKQRGCTIIYASHYMEEIEKVCDDVAFIDEGKIIEKGKIDDLLREYIIPAVFMKGEKHTFDMIEKYGPVQESKGGFLISTRNPLQTMEMILQDCRKSATRLHRLELVYPRLEDVFFSLTGSKLRA